MPVTGRLTWHRPASCGGTNMNSDSRAVLSVCALRGGALSSAAPRLRPGAKRLLPAGGFPVAPIQLLIVPNVFVR